MVRVSGEGDGEGLGLGLADLILEPVRLIADEEVALVLPPAEEVRVRVRGWGWGWG